MPTVPSLERWHPVMLADFDEMSLPESRDVSRARLGPFAMRQTLVDCPSSASSSTATARST